MGFLKFFRFRPKKKPASNEGVVSENRRNLILWDRVSETDVGLKSDSGARKFRWTEIESCTENFSTVVGSGGFSSVYLARFAARKMNRVAAVKILGSSERLTRMFRQELDILLQLRHQNIVNFIGYCDEREEGALVFEYVRNGTLQEKLHSGATTLPWKTRLTIAFQLASAIEYLHEKCSLQIVHGDIKSSNILLDEALNCKLCDFGSAKMGFSSSVANHPSSPFRAKQLMMGSPGYTDPHYLRTGIASKKNDVFSFGVVVLELVSGKHAFCPEKGLLLTSFLKADFEVTKMVDPRLKGDQNFEVEEALVLVSIASLCVSQAPTTQRPSISVVLQMMREKICSDGRRW